MLPTDFAFGTLFIVIKLYAPLKRVIVIITIIHCDLQRSSAAGKRIFCREQAWK